MDDDRRLQWVSANRAKRQAERRVGPALARVLETLALAGSERIDAVVERLDEVVDDEFRRHCRIGFLDAATLAIQVDSASLVYAMRARWLPAVQRVSGAIRTVPRIRRIVFAEGGDGTRLRAKPPVDDGRDPADDVVSGAGPRRE